MGEGYKPPLICIYGPTGSGKTDLAISISQQLGAPIINADSMQIYEECNILSAKPTLEEQSQAKFHLIDFVAINESFNSFRWRELALEIISKSQTPLIICGGTIEYFQNLFWQKKSENFQKFHDIDSKEKANKIYDELLEKYPEISEKIHRNDFLKIRKFLQSTEKLEKIDNPVFFINLTISPEILGSRIKHRAQKMLELGVLEEISTIKNKLDQLPKNEEKGGLLAAIGFNLDISDTDAFLEKLIGQTILYAKKQQKNVRILDGCLEKFDFDVTEINNNDNRTKIALEKIQEFLKNPKFLSEKNEKVFKILTCEKCGRQIDENSIQSHKKSKKCRNFGKAKKNL